MLQDTCPDSQTAARPIDHPRQIDSDALVGQAPRLNPHMADTSTAAHRSGPARTRRATYQDVLDAPAHRVAEIVDGTLYTQPRPVPRHAVASSYLGGA